MTPGGSLSERLGLSSASPTKSPEESLLLPHTPGGSLLNQIEQGIRQISEGSLRASQNILDKISMHDDNDDDDDDNYVSFTINDLDKSPVALEGAYSRPATQYTKAITLDLNKVADAIDTLKHEYHDDPPSFTNKPIPITSKVEIAQAIRNAKANKMTRPDRRSNPQYIKLNGYNVTNDFNIDRNGDVIPADYSKKTKVSKFKKNKEDAEQVKRAEDLKENALLGHSFSQPLLGGKSNNVYNTNSNSTSNIDIYDMRTKAPDVYVNQLLYDNDDDVLKLAYSVVLGLDRKLDPTTSSSSPKFAEGLVKAPLELEKLDIHADFQQDDHKDPHDHQSIELNDSLASSSLGRPPDAFDDLFDYRSSLKTPIMSLRDYAVSRQGSRGQEAVGAPPLLASSASLPSSPNYDRYLLKSRQTPLSLEPLKPQPLIPLTFGIDMDDEANLESELRALLRNSNSDMYANADSNINNNTRTASILPPLKQDIKPKSNNLKSNTNTSGRVKITNGTLLRSLSLASPRIGIDSNMLVSGTVPKVKKMSNSYINQDLNQMKPPLQSLATVSVSASVDSKLSKRIRSDITIATTNSHNVRHSYSDVLDDMSARGGSVNSTTSSLAVDGSTEMKVEVVTKKKKKDIEEPSEINQDSNKNAAKKKKKLKKSKKKNDNDNDNNDIQKI